MTTRSLDTALLLPTDTPAAGEAVSWNAAFRTLWAPFVGSVSPIFTGDPQAPTPAAADNDTSIATTAFVKTAIAPYALVASPTFTGDPKAPTPAPGDNDTSIATTAFVVTAISGSVAGVSSWNTRTGAVVLTGADVDAAGAVMAAGDSMTGVLGLIGGSAATPSVHFGTAGTGLHGSATAVAIDVAGVNKFFVSATQFAPAVPVAAADGAVGGPAFSFSGESTSGFYRAGAGDVRLAMGGADCVKFLTTGKTATFSGAVILAADPAAAMNPVTLQYLQAYTIDVGTY